MTRPIRHPADTLICGVVSDSNNTVDLQYTTLSQSLVMHTVGTHSQPVIRGQHQYFMVFTGCKLVEATLKDWLRACAKQVRLQISFRTVTVTRRGAECLHWGYVFRQKLECRCDVDAKKGEMLVQARLKKKKKK